MIVDGICKPTGKLANFDGFHLKFDVVTRRNSVVGLNFSYVNAASRSLLSENSY